MSISLDLARPFLGRTVDLVFDRPLGSRHPKHGFHYEVNYGFVPGHRAPDGHDLDAYYLGATGPLARASGVCIAIAHRRDDDDDKLIVAAPGFAPSDTEILAAIRFQEQWFDTEIIR